MMTPEQNKATVLRFYEEVINKQNVAVIDEILSPDWVNHDPNLPPIQGQESAKQRIGMFLAAFPDFHATLQSIIAEGNYVALHQTYTGTHQRELMGIPPTGNQINVTATHFHRLE